MNDEKGMRVLTSLVALGIFIVAGLALSLFHLY